jgi:hypothetical protein
MEEIMLKFSEFSHNHHPSGIKMLANFIRRGIRLKVILTASSFLMLFLAAACGGHPFDYILSPMETNVASSWTSTPVPTPTDTIEPTSTPTPTDTPFPTDTPAPTFTLAPTRTLPLNVTVHISNQLDVKINITCSGPYELNYIVSALDTQTIHVPTGTYNCMITASGLSPIDRTKYWSPGSYDWTFYRGSGGEATARPLFIGPGGQLVTQTSP